MHSAKVWQDSVVASEVECGKIYQKPHNNDSCCTASASSSLKGGTENSHNGSSLRLCMKALLASLFFVTAALCGFVQAAHEVPFAPNIHSCINPASGSCSTTRASHNSGLRWKDGATAPKSFVATRACKFSGPHRLDQLDPYFRNDCGVLRFGIVHDGTCLQRNDFLYYNSGVNNQADDAAAPACLATARACKFHGSHRDDGSCGPDLASNIVAIADVAKLLALHLEATQAAQGERIDTNICSGI